MLKLSLVLILITFCSVDARRKKTGGGDECKNLTGLAVNPEKFFSGTWYDQRISHNFFFEGRRGRCPTINAKVEANKAILTLSQFEPKTQSYYERTGEVNLSEIKDDNVFAMRILNLTGTEDVTVPLKIVATDNEKFAVLYSCENHEKTKEELTWILTRDRGDRSYDPEIKKLVNGLGLRYNRLLKQSSTRCSPNAKKLPTDSEHEEDEPVFN